MLEYLELLHSNVHVHTSSLIWVDTELRLMCPSRLSGTTYIISLHTDMHAICSFTAVHEAVIVVILVSWRLFTVCLNILGVGYAHI